MVMCKRPEDAEQARISAQIDRQLRRDANNEIGNQKLILLGTGECGKSTVLKQMNILHKDGFSETQLALMAGAVYSNLVSGMANLLRARETFMYPLSDSDADMDARRIMALAESGKEHEPFTNAVYMALKNLWQQPNIQRTYQRRAEFQLGDSFEYFMLHLDRINDPEFKPTPEDALRIRVPTTGVVQVHFKIKGCLFRVFDVGGQRSERRKWIHHFDDVNAIIFITAISEFDQTLMEDGKTNRLVESMDLFAQICNSKWFVTAAIILFLNKKDLFEKKIKSVPISYLFKEYKGENEYAPSIEHIRYQFEKRNEHPQTKKIYPHETCATDTNQVQLVIDSVIDMVIAKNLRGTGME
ncbi:unnamed protein product [Caenorhabditis auriculariae]|uniref:Uncharacterized protein n=1 Tax=Caenorhabditis auriculariae TaxID=2777116 RepID=A0A8S1GTZ8_9PELO|nr:unnamed protein product [Caenorhabditis auriculariae]